MFDLSLSLNPNGSITLDGTNSAKVFDLVDFPSQGQSVRRVAATALTTPETLTISHRDFVEKGQPMHQHLVRMDIAALSALGVKQPCAAWLVVKHPGDNVTVTPAMIKDMVYRLFRLMTTTGYLDKIINGEP